jgi:hypothetical protein
MQRKVRLCDSDNIDLFGQFRISNSALPASRIRAYDLGNAIQSAETKRAAQTTESLGAVKRRQTSWS